MTAPPTGDSETIAAAITQAFATATAPHTLGLYVATFQRHSRLELRDAISGTVTTLATVPNSNVMSAATAALEALHQARTAHAHKIHTNAATRRQHSPKLAQSSKRVAGALAKTASAA